MEKDLAGRVMAQEYRFYVGGQWCSSGNTYEVRNPFDASLVGVVHRPNPEHIQAAIAAAEAAFETTRQLSSCERADILEAIRDALLHRIEEMAQVIALEAGKCLGHARSEVERAAVTFTLAMEEAKRMVGTTLPLDIVPANRGRFGIVINDVPTFRVDNQPYGGMKDSGFGREGVRYAMEEMTDLKILSINPGK